MPKEKRSKLRLSNQLARTRRPRPRMISFFIFFVYLRLLRLIEFSGEVSYVSNCRSDS